MTSMHINPVPGYAGIVYHLFAHLIHICEAVLNIYKSKMHRIMLHYVLNRTNADPQISRTMHSGASRLCGVCACLCVCVCLCLHLCGLNIVVHMPRPVSSVCRADFDTARARALSGYVCCVCGMCENAYVRVHAWKCVRACWARFECRAIGRK